MNKALPQNIDAEMAVLGSCLLSESSVDESISNLIPDDFYLEKHSFIFKKIMEMAAQKKPVDILTIRPMIAGYEGLTDYYLTELVERIPSTENVIYYINMVKNKSILRKLIQIIHKSNENAFNPTADNEQIIESIQNELYHLQRNESKIEDLSVLTYNAIEQIEAIHQAEGGIIGVPTGYSKLDMLLSGMNKTDLLILAAPPSHGKTAFMLNIAKNAASAGNPVGIFSFEMGSIQLANRILCSHAKIDAHRARIGKLQEKDFAMISHVAHQVAGLPIYIEDTSGKTIESLRSSSRKMIQKQGVKLIIVDYLQLIRTNHRYESKNVQVGEVSGMLKSIARDFDVPVLCLSQLSREAYRTGRRPTMADLRDSGMIEADADVIMFIYRPHKSGEVVHPGDENLAEIIIDKQRKGPTGTVNLRFDETTLNFQNLDTTHDDF